MASPTGITGEPKKLDRKAARAEAQFAVQEEVWSQVEERVQKTADHYRTRLNILLQQAAQRRSKPRSNRDLVDELLAARLDSSRRAGSQHLRAALIG